MSVPRAAEATMLLSNALGQQGRFEGGEAASKQAIAMLESQPDFDPSKIAGALSDLSISLAKKGQIQH